MISLHYNIFTSRYLYIMIFVYACGTSHFRAVWRNAFELAVVRIVSLMDLSVRVQRFRNSFTISHPEEAG